jgi:hypothetical protein
MSDSKPEKIMGLFVQFVDETDEIIPLAFRIGRCPVYEDFTRETLKTSAAMFAQKLISDQNYTNFVPAFGLAEERFMDNRHERYQRHGHVVQTAYGIIEDLDEYFKIVDVESTPEIRGRTITEIITSCFSVDFPPRLYNISTSWVNNGEVFLGAIVYFLDNMARGWFDATRVVIDWNTYPLLDPNRRHGGTRGDTFNIYAPGTAEDLLQAYMTPYIPEYHYDRSVHGGHVMRMWLSVKTRFYLKAARACPATDVANKARLTSIGAVFTGKLLHIVQDFYSHSNFAELLLADLCNQTSFDDRVNWAWDDLRALNDAAMIRELSNLIGNSLETIPTLKEIIEWSYASPIEFTGDFLGAADLEINSHQICRVIRDAGVGAYHDYDGPTGDMEAGTVGESHFRVYNIEKDKMIIVVESISTIREAPNQDATLNKKANQVVKAFEVVVENDRKVFYGIAQENGVWVRKKKDEGGQPFYTWPVLFGEVRILPMYPWRVGGYRPSARLIKKMSEDIDHVSPDETSGLHDGLLTGYISEENQEDKNYLVRNNELRTGLGLNDESGVSNKRYPGDKNIRIAFDKLAAAKAGLTLDDAAAMSEYANKEMKLFQNMIQKTTEPMTLYQTYKGKLVGSYSNWMKTGPVYKHWEDALGDNAEIISPALDHMNSGSYRGYPEHYADLHKDFTHDDWPIFRRGRRRRFTSFGETAEDSVDVNPVLQSLLFWVCFKAAVRDTRMTYLKLLGKRYTEINTRNWNLMQEEEQLRAQFLMNLDQNFHVRDEDYVADG